MLTTLRHTSGYQEPLPAEARAEIDAKYSVDPSKYQFKGCLSDDKVTRETHAFNRNPRSRTMRHKKSHRTRAPNFLKITLRHLLL
jgi:hypothetical protein